MMLSLPIGRPARWQMTLSDPGFLISIFVLAVPLSWCAAKFWTNPAFLPGQE